MPAVQAAVHVHAPPVVVDPKPSQAGAKVLPGRAGPLLVLLSAMLDAWPDHQAVVSLHEELQENEATSTRMGE